MTNVQADIQVDAGNNAWLLTLPEVRIEGSYLRSVLSSPSGL
ncbi:hypothetical protein RBI80_32350 (plasmid) [Klebsiella variicola]|nr:hypothetical protein RBI80_32350 [Klebsiella variicola]